MHLQDHDIVVEDEGVLFRACVTAAALDALQRRAGRPQPAEALIADHRAKLEQLAIAGFRAGEAGSAPISIDAEDVEGVLAACPDQAWSARVRHGMAGGLFRPRRHRPGH